MGIEFIHSPESEMDRLNDLSDGQDSTDGHPGPDGLISAKKADKGYDREPKDGRQCEQPNQGGARFIVNKPPADQIVGQPKTPESAQETLWTRTYKK